MPPKKAGEKSKTAAGLIDQHVAYLGPRGTFSEIAAKALFPRGTLQATPTVPEIGAALAASNSLCAVLPFENSDAGFVTETIDILCRRLPVFVTGVKDLPIRFSLYRLANDRSPLGGVLSHPIALRQCEEWLARRKVQAVPVSSTSEGPNKVLTEKLQGVGAIAASGQGAIFGLEEIEVDLQGVKPRKTRFVRLERQARADKTARRLFVVAEGSAGLTALVSGRLLAKARNVEIAGSKSAKALSGFSYVVHAELGRPMTTKALLSTVLGKNAKLIGWTS